jgi:hypothetical protein
MVVGAVAGPKGLPAVDDMKKTTDCISMTELGHINVCQERLQLTYSCSNLDGTGMQIKKTDLESWKIGVNSFENSVVYECDNGISKLIEVTKI